MGERAEAVKEQLERFRQYKRLLEEKYGEMAKDVEPLLQMARDMGYTKVSWEMGRGVNRPTFGGWKPEGMSKEYEAWLWGPPGVPDPWGNVHEEG